jgi:hypothetical protein
MKDARLWEPVVGHLAHPLPGQRVLLAAAPQRPPPEPDDMITERAKRPRVGRHGVVGIVAGDDQLEPFPLLGDGLLQALAQFVLDLPQLRTSAVPPTFAADLERDAPGVSASILEGIDEILTVTRLGLPVELRRSLACTNIIET